MLDVADVLALAGGHVSSFSARHGQRTPTQLEGCSAYLLTHADYIIMTTLVTSNCLQMDFKS